MRGDRTTCRQEETAFYQNRRFPAFRAKHTLVREKRNPIFYFEESFGLQQYNMFGRAPSSRRSHDEEQMFCGHTCRILCRHSLTAKTPFHRMVHDTTGFTSLARLRTWKLTQLLPPVMGAGHSVATYRYRGGSVSSWGATWRAPLHPVPTNSCRTHPASANRTVNALSNSCAS